MIQRRLTLSRSCILVAATSQIYYAEPRRGYGTQVKECLRSNPRKLVVTALLAVLIIVLVRFGQMEEGKRTHAFVSRS
jgi:hypothetical protein